MKDFENVFITLVIAAALTIMVFSISHCTLETNKAENATAVVGINKGMSVDEMLCLRGHNYNSCERQGAVRQITK